MPRKTKEQTEKENLKKETVKKTSNKKASTIKASAKAEKTTTAKKATKSSSTAKKATTTKKASTTKASSTTKKSTSKKATKSATKKTVASTKITALPIAEYYDLPYRYNQTIVKLLAQTPTNLFVYWDISDEDIKNYKKEYGENFFETTKPVLIIHNITMNYSFEVEINDFANSWYIHVNDSKCDYNVELGRRPIPFVSTVSVDYIYVSSSNEIESPNDKILFNNDEHRVYFRNVKTNLTSTKSISFIKSMGKIYNIYDFYKAIYKEEVQQQNMSEDLPSSLFK